MPETVCFDLDDTLFDYGQYVRSGFRTAAEEIEAATGAEVYEDLERAYFEDGVRNGTFDRVLADRGLEGRVDVDDLVAAFHRRVGDVTPYRSATTVLEDLRRDHDLALVSDGRNGEEKLGELGLESYFDAVLVGPDHGLSKRDPEAFERVLSELDTDPGDAVHVGDNPAADFPAANDLGMGTVRLLRGRYADASPTVDERADVRVRALALVPTAVRSL
jgi:putative hydrolase of the HAD superfamily